MAQHTIYICDLCGSQSKMPGSGKIRVDDWSDSSGRKIDEYMDICSICLNKIKNIISKMEYKS